MVAPDRVVGLLVLQFNSALRPLRKAKARFEDYLKDAEPYMERDAMIRKDVIMARKIVSKLTKLEEAMKK